MLTTDPAGPIDLAGARPDQPPVGPAPVRTAACIAVATAASVPALRRFVRGVAASWGLSAADGHTLELVVSELAGNAVRHSGGPDVAVLVRAAGATLTVEVRDGGRWRQPPPRPASDGGEPACGGRGLGLVEAYSTRCAVHATAAGTRVVAELPYR
ncbi:ATP-binding protein [Kitasatospora cinereorecta]|uniref:ATP-binding protein n=1 Tax=Kitasatospora cinereorecta TaxID=285560 RepID=A0ABW0VRY6_9ACTN